MSWAVVSVVATVVIAASAAAGVSYTVYSATNPPKTPQQATSALNKNSLQLTKLQGKKAELNTKPESAHNTKQKTDVDNAIAKVQGSIDFLNNWINTYGNTATPTKSDKDYAAIASKNKLVNAAANSSTPSGGAVVTTGATNHYGLIGIISGGLMLVVFIVLIALKKHK